VQTAGSPRRWWTVYPDVAKEKTPIVYLIFITDLTANLAV